MSDELVELVKVRTCAECGDRACDSCTTVQFATDKWRDALRHVTQWHRGRFKRCSPAGRSEHARAIEYLESLTKEPMRKLAYGEGRSHPDIIGVSKGIRAGY